MILEKPFLFLDVDARFGYRKITKIRHHEIVSLKQQTKKVGNGNVLK